MKPLHQTMAHRAIAQIQELVPANWRSQSLTIRMGRSTLYVGDLNGEPDPTLFREGRAHYLLQMLERYLDVEPTQHRTNTDLVCLSIEVGGTEFFRLGWYSQVEVNQFWEIRNPKQPAPPIAISQSQLIQGQTTIETFDLSWLGEYAGTIAGWMGYEDWHKVKSFAYREYRFQAAPEQILIFKNEKMIFCSQLPTGEIQCSASKADLECIYNLYILARCWKSYWMRSRSKINR